MKIIKSRQELSNNLQNIQNKLTIIIGDPNIGKTTHIPKMINALYFTFDDQGNNIPISKIENCQNITNKTIIIDEIFTKNIEELVSKLQKQNNKLIIINNKYKQSSWENIIKHFKKEHNKINFSNSLFLCLECTLKIL